MTPLLLALTLAAPPIALPKNARSLSRTPDTAAAGAPIEAAPAPQAPHALFGVVTEQGTLDCAGAELGDPATHAGTWSDLYHEVGFVRLVEPAFDPTPLVGRPVLALGTPRDGPPPARAGGGCVAHQARGDWVYGKGGHRIRRSPEPPHVAFQPTSVTPLGADVLRAHRVDDQIEITFRNPLDRPLTDLIVTLHHEGCYGKPMRAERTAAHPRLAPGDAFTARLPMMVDRGDPEHPRHHAAVSVSIDATGERVAFDLDVPLSAYDAAVECPDDGRKR